MAQALECIEHVQSEQKKKVKFRAFKKRKLSSPKGPEPSIRDQSVDAMTYVDPTVCSRNLGSSGSAHSYAAIIKARKETQDYVTTGV